MKSRFSLYVVATAALAKLLLVATEETHADELPAEGLTAQSHKGMVVSVSRPASEVGRQILDAGGNAVDAAVAVGFALAVTFPEAGNIGGGGFMLVHPAKDQAPTVFEYREMAPAAATVDMFSNGDESQYLLVGVPGTARGLELAHRRFGRLSWKSVVQPAVELARDGFVVSHELADSLNYGIKTCNGSTEFLRVFGGVHENRTWRAGDRLTQPDLATTLNLIANEGSDAFYTGSIATLFEAEMRHGGGLISRSDLASYKAHERKPIHGIYRGYDLFASSPPSSGGTVLVEMLNQAEGFELRKQGRWSPLTLHIMIECMRRAYCDRARFLGDPDFTSIPAELTTKDHASKLRKTISPSIVTSSAKLGADILSPVNESHKTQTTHFSVIDADGMAVSNTYTLEEEFGSRIVVRGAGFLLNNEMGDFNPKPGVTDTKGLIGTKPNLVAPQKRMLSSMCPTIVSKDGKVVLVTGSPGGRTIINTVFCMVMNVLEFEMPIRDAVDAPRMHHGWMPDIVRMEKKLIDRYSTSLDTMKEMGHSIDPNPAKQGDAHSILVSPTTGLRTGAVDSRRGGWAAGQ